MKNFEFLHADEIQGILAGTLLNLAALLHFNALKVSIY